MPRRIGTARGSKPAGRDAVVTIEEAGSAPDPSGRIQACELAAPTAGHTEQVFSFPVEAFVGGRPEVQAVTVRDELGVRLNMRIVPPLDGGPSAQRAEGEPESRFAARVNALELPRRFELSLVPELEDGRPPRIAFIKGTRRPLPVQAQAQFQPLIVTTMGRSGSTWLLWMLGRHPDIVAYRAQEFETRAASYFSDVLRTLSRPSGYISALRGYEGAFGWLGLNPSYPLSHYESDPSLEQWLGAEYLEELIAFVTQRIDALYRRMAALEGKDNALYFVEKSSATGPQAMFAEIYPKARELILVRDFRDFVCSARAYAASRLQRRWYDGSGASTDEGWIRGGLAGEVRMLLRCWRARSEDSFLLKYEDLVTRTEQTLASVFSYVGVDSSPAAVAYVLSAAATRNLELERFHRTSASARESIGRWKTDLSPSLQRACSEALGEALESFGYT
jgi:hypothetical protein